MAESASGASDAKAPETPTPSNDRAPAMSEKASSTIGTEPGSDVPLLKDGEVNASVEASTEEADGRPEGYEPTRPAHFYLAFWLLAVGLANDGLQVSTLVFADMRGSAAACAVCTVITLVLITGIHVQDKTSPWKEVRASAQRGEPTELWEGTVSLEQSVQRLGVGFAAAYGMTCVGTLSAWSAASALLGLALSTHSSTDLLVLLECSRPSAVKALRPRTFWALVAWCGCRMAAEISFFAIAASTLHPLIVFAVLFLCFFLQRVTAHELGYEEPAGLVSLLPVNWSRGKASVLCITHGKTKKPMPAWPVVMAIWVRFLLLGYLSQMHLPKGLLGLGAPMGRDKWKKLVAIPLHAVLKAGSKCVGGNAVGWWPFGYDADADAWWRRIEWSGFSFQTCSIDGIGDMTLGTAYFRCTLASVAYVTVPLYLIGSLIMLGVNAKYRKGEVDEDLQHELKGKYAAIKKWTDERAAAGPEPPDASSGGGEDSGCARSLVCCHRQSNRDDGKAMEEKLDPPAARGADQVSPDIP